MQNNSVTCIITFHKEGILAYKTLFSIERCRKYAEKYNIEVHFICTLDKANEETTNIVKRHPVIKSTDKIFEIDVGSPALSRNYAIQNVTTTYISIHDGDDYYSENILKEYVDTYTKINKNIVLHPEYVFNFQDLWILDQVPTFCKHNLLDIGFYNYYTVVSFARTSIYKEISYPINNFKNGFGHEDWLWNIKIIEKKYEHIVVPNTVLFYRRKKSNSTSVLASSYNATIYPTEFFNTFYTKNNRDNIELKKSIISIFIQRVYLYLFRNILNNLPTHALDHLFVFFIHVMQKILCIHFPENVIHFKNMLQFTKKKSFPKIIINEMKALDIDSILNNANRDKTTKRNIEIRKGDYFYNIFNSNIGEIYANIWSKLTKYKFDICFLVHSLQVTGADSVYCLLANTFVAKGQKVLMIVTENPDINIPDGFLSKDVTVLSIASLLCKVIQEEKVELINRLLLQLQPKIIHNIHSNVGWEVFQKYGRSISYFSKIYVSLFLEWKRKNGTPYGYATWYLDDSYSFITKIFSDNQNYLNMLVQKYGIPKDKLYCFYNPVSFLPSNVSFSQGTKVLWASRLDHEKKVDVLLEIAISMPHLHFDVYGYRLRINEKDDPILSKTIKQLSKCKNVTLKGKYNGFSSILHNEYFVFLYTTNFDGMPNVLLEATAFGLPIIAPNIGGISELVINKKTGILLRKK